MKMRYKLLICVLVFVLVGGYFISKAIYTVRTADWYLTCDYDGYEFAFSLYADANTNSALVIDGWKFRKVYFSWVDEPTEGGLAAVLVNRNREDLYGLSFENDKAYRPIVAYISDFNKGSDKTGLRIYSCTGKIRRQK